MFYYCDGTQYSDVYNHDTDLNMFLSALIMKKFEFELQALSEIPPDCVCRAETVPGAI